MAVSMTGVHHPAPRRPVSATTRFSAARTLIRAETAFLLAHGWVRKRSMPGSKQVLWSNNPHDKYLAVWMNQGNAMEAQKERDHAVFHSGFYGSVTP